MKQLTLLLTVSIILASCGNNKLPSELTTRELSGLKGDIKTCTQAIYFSSIYDGEDWQPVTDSNYSITTTHYDRQGYITDVYITRCCPTADRSVFKSHFILQKIIKDNKLIAYDIRYEGITESGTNRKGTKNLVWVNDYILLEYMNKYGDTIFSHRTEYDHNNRVIFKQEHTIVNGEFPITSFNKYFYNNDGLLIKDSAYSTMNDDTNGREIIYKGHLTDKYGNVIHKLSETIHNGDTSRRIIKSNIEYYN